MKLFVFALPVAMAGLLAAQTTSSSAKIQSEARHSPTESTAGNHGMLVKRLTAKLNLTAQQQNQAASIFQNAHQQIRALPNLNQEHSQLENAIKSDNQAQIDSVLKENSNVNTRALEIYTNSMAKFYQTLNPTQKGQFDQMMAQQWKLELGSQAPSTTSR